jgi:hypothetical protein
MMIILNLQDVFLPFAFCEYKDIGRYLKDFDFFTKWIWKVRVDGGSVREKEAFYDCFIEIN